MEPQPLPTIFTHATLQTLKDIKRVKEELASGKEIRELVHIGVEELARLYNAACKFLTQKEYEKALHAFLFLAFLDRKQCDLWLGLGMSLQMTHHYEAAIDAYELAANCDIENPVPYFYLAKCLFSIHDHEASLEALDSAILYAQDREAYTDLLQQALIAKQVLLRRK